MWLLSNPLSGQVKTASALLSAAIYEEEVSGNLDKAMELYLDILKKYSNDRPVAAKRVCPSGMASAYFWTSWHGGPSSAWYRILWNRTEILEHNILNRSYGFSIRCIRN